MIIRILPLHDLQVHDFELGNGSHLHSTSHPNSTRRARPRPMKTTASTSRVSIPCQSDVPTYPRLLTLNPTGRTGSRCSNAGSGPSPRKRRKVCLAAMGGQK